ncbi:NAD(P)-dependent alcohol dehydrogenase [Nocardioides sp.]|uniref:NAD(P)-dependent alcohol dehydrogenase n=1 Tax=Nocardioides sp. TaxID=35761 RepID=UPI00271E182F|nr:NAD(P)-dependent alcohol dehydrogenase [Nocardioides sp.]MDO9455870.1 NAD(P)-dependent alcohol dehydrogenase [Nocardioides sp.]
MKTTAAVVHEQGQEFILEEVDLDEPRADEVLVTMVATGLCHTDISLRDSLPAEMFPRVFGHEGAGVVEQVGADVTGIEVGDHVVLSFRSCRECGPCREGAVGYCDNALMLNYMGFRMDGSTTHQLKESGAPLYGSFFGQSSLAQHAIAYADNCVVVDESLDLTLLAPYGCGFQTGAGTVLNVFDPSPDQSIVVFGVGAVGIAAVAAARAAGVEIVVAVDLMDSRLEVAERYGAQRVNPAYLGEQSVPDRVKELTGGGASYAIDTTAVSAVVKQAQLSLRARGTLVALGLGTDEYAVDAIDLLQSGKVIRSSIEGDSDPLEMIPRLLAMRADGRFEVDHLVTTYPFTQINQAVLDVLAGTVVKPVLVW